MFVNQNTGGASEYYIVVRNASVHRPQLNVIMLVECPGVAFVPPPMINIPSRRPDTRLSAAVAGYINKDRCLEAVDCRRTLVPDPESRPHKVPARPATPTSATPAARVALPVSVENRLRGQSANSTDLASLEPALARPSFGGPSNPYRCSGTGVGRTIQRRRGGLLHTLRSCCGASGRTSMLCRSRASRPQNQQQRYLNPFQTPHSRSQLAR